MDAAVAAVRARAHLDEQDLDIAAGTPRLLLRFSVPASETADEDAAAQAVVAHLHEAVDAEAILGRTWLLRRNGGRWDLRPWWPEITAP